MEEEEEARLSAPSHVCFQDTLKKEESSAEEEEEATTEMSVVLEEGVSPNIVAPRIYLCNLYIVASLSCALL